MDRNDAFAEDLGLIGDATQGQSQQAQGCGLWPEPDGPPGKEWGPQPIGHLFMEFGKL